MAKGSQLTQLKSALAQAGLSRQSQPGGNGKKRKRSAAAVRDPALDNEKKAKKLSQIHSSLNAFDVKVNKLKHDVGGRNVKGVTGRPGLSKQAGIDQRKRSLLVEYEQKDRAGGVVDRRFGENDSSLTAEERMLERFTKERQRNSRGVNYNLEDEDDLTHYGKSLSALDDFDGANLGLDDDDEERGQIDGKTVQSTHFGGFEDDDEEDVEGQPERKKSKAEVMAEVMAKSKEHKYQRQLAKEQDDQVRHDMDKDFNSIRDLLFGATIDPSSSGSNAVPLGKRPTADTTEGVDSSEHKSLPLPLPSATSDAIHEEGDLDYDQVVRALAFDKRAKPTDRTKTEEETAAEEKAKLEKAERARLRRMNGEEGGSDDEGGRRGAKRRRAEADDLEDDFVDEGDVGTLGRGLGDEASAASDEDEDEDGDGANESDSGEDEAQSEAEIEDSDEERSVEGDVEDLVAAPRPNKKVAGKAKAKAGPNELPYTFPCPSTHDEFLDIIETIDTEDVPTVVQRIRVIYHASLGEENKFKLQTLCSVLIDHVLYAAAPPTPSFSLITGLSPHIFSLSQTYPIASAQAFNAKLVLMQKNLARGLARGAHLPDSKTFPGPSELALLRLVGVIWSTSDLAHAVVTPALLLIGQYLAQSRVRSISDVASGLFLCTLLLQYQSLSERLVPEAINFLINALLHLATHNLEPHSLPGSFPSPDFTPELHAALRLKAKASSNLTPGPIDFVSVLASGADAEISEQSKVDALAATFSLLARFAKLYTSLDAFIELFNPAVEVLSALTTKSMSSALKKAHTDVSETLGRMLKFSLESRQPLALQAHKPIPIASYIPKFDAGYSHQKRHDPDSERNADSKIKALYRKEHKGAMRELRKDNRFLAGEQAKKQAEKDATYASKMAKVHGEIQVERAEEKSLAREKARDERRAGRKK